MLTLMLIAACGTPDLAISIQIEQDALSVPLNIAVTFLNLGDGDAANVRSDLFLSADSQISDADYQVYSFTTGSVPSGSTAETKRIPMGEIDRSQVPAGSYYVCARVDPVNEIAESTETNNDGISQDQIVVASADKDITLFSFTKAKNPGLQNDVLGTITGTAISATLPPGSSLTALKASFTTTGASAEVSGITQTSGITVNNFTNPVNYVVIARDGSTKSYTVTVGVQPSQSGGLGVHVK
jgi:hypothetical protein